MAATYSYAQLEQLWLNNGGPKAVAPVAAAIAMAESRGISNAAYPGTTVPDGSGTWNDATGLWQILGAPSGTSPSGAPWSAAALTDPNANAQMAVAKYQQAGGFSPWATYTSGAYKGYLNGSTTPDPNVPGASSTSATATSSTTRCLVGGNSFIPCLLDASQARGLIGGLCLVGGMLVLGLGIGVLVAVSAEKAGVVSALPGPAGQVGQVADALARRGKKKAPPEEGAPDKPAAKKPATKKPATKKPKPAAP